MVKRKTTDEFKSMDALAIKMMKQQRHVCLHITKNMKKEASRKFAKLMENL